MSTETERRPVVGYEGLYEVSSDGEVFRVASASGTQVGRKLKPSINSCGYLFVSLHRNGVRKQLLVHRIVVQAFKSNPNNLPQVNHINGIKIDNREENLEWCDCSYNQLHSYHMLGRVGNRNGKPKPEGAGVPKRPVRGTNMKTGEVVEMESTCSAGRFVHGCQGYISKTCQGKYKQAYGWQWEYI